MNVRLARNSVVVVVVVAVAVVIASYEHCTYTYLFKHSQKPRVSKQQIGLE
jgi:uncharacterized membrane protein YdbT with pleckstrin-like domain